MPLEVAWERWRQQYLISSGPLYLQYYQTVALADVDGGLAGVVHVEDVGLLDCHRAIGQIVAPEDSGALADLQLNLRCLVQSDILHFLYFNWACPTECPVKWAESEVSTPVQRSEIGKFWKKIKIWRPLDWVRQHVA